MVAPMTSPGGETVRRSFMCASCLHSSSGHCRNGRDIPALRHDHNTGAVQHSCRVGRHALCVLDGSLSGRRGVEASSFRLMSPAVVVALLATVFLTVGVIAFIVARMRVPAENVTVKTDGGQSGS